MYPRAIIFGIGVAVEARPPRVAGPPLLFGRLGQWDVAARELVHGTVSEAARPQVPAAIGAEWCLYHWHPDAGDVVAIRVDCRNQHRVPLARYYIRRLLEDTALRFKAEIQQRQRIGLVRNGYAGNRRELPTPFLELNRRPVGALRDAAVGRGDTVRRPAVHRVDRRAEQHRGRDRVQKILPNAALQRFWDWIGKMLRAGPEINSHSRRLRQIVGTR